MLRLSKKSSPLLPLHTGSSLHSNRRSSGSSTLYTVCKYLVVLLIVSAAIYTLDSTVHRSKVGVVIDSDRSGRQLAEDDKTRNIAAVTSDKLGAFKGDGRLKAKSSKLLDVQSQAGREEVLQLQTQGEGHKIRQEPVKEAESTPLEEQATAVVNSIAQPILQKSVVAGDLVATAAEKLQDSAGQMDAAAGLVTADMLPNDNHGDKAGNTPDATQEAKLQDVPTVELVPASGLYTMEALDIDDQEVALSKYRGKVSLVVNVASQCGYTDSNYKGLNQLYEKYHAQGLEILAFPCNSWNQETGSAADIKDFAKSKYGIKFDLFAKLEAIGANAHPVMKWLTENLPEYKLTGWKPQWNFSKWLVDRHGMPVKSYGSDFDLGLISKDIEEQLNQTNGVSSKQISSRA